jgi:hypothetical protein
MMLERVPAVVFGALNVLSALVIAVGVFLGLPERYLPVDGGAVLLMALLLASGVGLLTQARWGALVAAVASGVTLGLGLLFIAALSISAAFLAGVYGPVGRGGAVIFVLVLALAIPYVVAIPLAELVWLRRRVNGAPK